MKTPQEQAEMLVNAGAPKMLAVWAINSVKFQTKADEYWDEVMSKYLELTAPKSN